MTEKENDIVFEVKEHLGVINKYTTGWTKELNLISWNGQPPKYDVRDWSPDHERMSRGVTLHYRELRKIVDFFLKSSNRRIIEKEGCKEGENADEVEPLTEDETENTAVSTGEKRVDATPF